MITNNIKNKYIYRYIDTDATDLRLTLVDRLVDWTAMNSHEQLWTATEQLWTAGCSGCPRPVLPQWWTTVPSRKLNSSNSVLKLRCPATMAPWNPRWYLGQSCSAVVTVLPCVARLISSCSTQSYLVRLGSQKSWLDPTCAGQFAQHATTRWNEIWSQPRCSARFHIAGQLPQKLCLCLKFCRLQVYFKSSMTNLYFWKEKRRTWCWQRWNKKLNIGHNMSQLQAKNHVIPQTLEIFRDQYRTFKKYENIIIASSCGRLSLLAFSKAHTEA